MHFGPYALKLAEQFVERRKERDFNLLKQGIGHQEMISFVQMEYFLFGVSEADQIVEELKTLETAMKRLMDSIDTLEAEMY